MGIAHKYLVVYLAKKLREENTLQLSCDNLSIKAKRKKKK